MYRFSRGIEKQGRTDVGLELLILLLSTAFQIGITFVISKSSTPFQDTAEVGRSRVRKALQSTF